VALDAVKIRNHGQQGELSRRQSYGLRKGVAGVQRYRRSPAGKKTASYETAAPTDSAYDDSFAEPLAEPAADSPPATTQKPDRNGAKKGGRGRRQVAADEGKSNPAAEVLLVRVDSDTVKIRNLGKYGNIAQPSAPSAVSSRLVFDDQFGKEPKEKQERRRRSTAGFIPFSEYDSRRVQILKVEQNDFMALPKRLAAPPLVQNANQQSD